MHEIPPTPKVFYRSIEAAIRWAGLLKYERQILSAVGPAHLLPDELNCPRWREFRLCVERIYDGIFNGELPYGRNGITMNDRSLWGSPELTIRHIDLKRWMRQHYPEHKPGFLFSRAERIAHPFISLESGQTMLVERVALKSALKQSRTDLRKLQEIHDTLLKKFKMLPQCTKSSISDRAEATYLNIIGGMLELFLGQSPSGTAYSCFRTQEAVVSALIAHHGGAMGITERTLNGKFAAARRRLHSATL